VVWLDGLDIPLVRFFDAGFMENGAEEVSTASVPRRRRPSPIRTPRARAARRAAPRRLRSTRATAATRVSQSQ
jgi:gentisate 1,2-dioxygenase